MMIKELVGIDAEFIGRTRKKRMPLSYKVVYPHYVSSSAMYYRTEWVSEQRYMDLCSRLGKERVKVLMKR